jgi:transposase-like protein
MDEEAAYEWFKQARWPSTGGEPTCPECGLIGATQRRKRRFRCRAKVCAAEFSVTSGTILASRKLSFKTLLLALALSVHSVKGKAACELKRELGVDYKTAFVLLHKLREAVAALRIAVKLDGIVEMDGMYVGGHVRPKNEKAKRVDRRLAENRTGKRMAVMVLRQRAGDNMTLAAAVPGEQGDVAWHLTKNHVARTASLRADQHPAYDELGGLNEIVRNNHDRAYVVEADFSTNQAESFFSRVRRGEIGIFHHIAGKYLDWYAADLAWREDKRRTDFRLHADAVLKSALAHPISRDMAGYWQRPNKAKTPLVAWNPLRGMLAIA